MNKFKLFQTEHNYILRFNINVLRLEEHWKAIVRGEIEKLGIVDHIQKEKVNHFPLWDKVEIIDRAELWRIRRLKESAHMLDYNDLLSRPSIFVNEPKLIFPHS